MKEISEKNSRQNRENSCLASLFILLLPKIVCLVNNVKGTKMIGTYEDIVKNTALVMMPVCLCLSTETWLGTPRLDLSPYISSQKVQRISGFQCSGALNKKEAQEGHSSDRERGNSRNHRSLHVLSSVSEDKWEFAGLRFNLWLWGRQLCFFSWWEI